jgi:hypothetical protein
VTKSPPPFTAAFTLVPRDLFGLDVEHREALGLADEQVKILTEACARYQETADVNIRRMARNVANVHHAMYGETLPTTEQMKDLDDLLVQWAALALELARAQVAGTYHGMKALTPEQLTRRAALHVDGDLHPARPLAAR